MYLKSKSTKLNGWRQPMAEKGFSNFSEHLILLTSLTENLTFKWT